MPDAKRPATHRIGARLASAEGRAACAERKWLSVEPNGWINEAPGFRRFLLRSLKKVRWEWSPICLAQGIRWMKGLAAACRAAQCLWHVLPCSKAEGMGSHIHGNILPAP